MDAITGRRPEKHYRPFEEGGPDRVKEKRKHAVFMEAMLSNIDQTQSKLDLSSSHIKVHCGIQESFLCSSLEQRKKT